MKKVLGLEKRNENWIVKLKKPNNKATKKDHFVWANIWQIKKLCLEECVINHTLKLFYS